MKKTIGDWMTVASGLRQLVPLNLPSVPSYRLGRLASKLQEELNAVEKKRIELVKRYGKQTDDTDTYQVPEENRTVFEQEYQALLNEELEIEHKPIELKSLGDAKVSPAAFAATLELFTD